MRMGIMPFVDSLLPMGINSQFAFHHRARGSSLQIVGSRDIDFE